MSFRRMVYLYGLAARAANLKIEGRSLGCKPAEEKLKIKYSKVKIVTVQKNVAKQLGKVTLPTKKRHFK